MWTRIISKPSNETFTHSLAELTLGNRAMALLPRGATGVRCDQKRPIPAHSPKDLHMSATNGTIKRITDKGFGFIAAPDGTEYFFHQSACTSTPFDSMREGENVTFTVGQGPKGPRAENVVPA